MVIRLFLFLRTVADIQEFYELTLLDESKSVQQKTAETIRIADKWEASDGPITPTFAQNDVSTVISLSSAIHMHAPRAVREPRCEFLRENRGTRRVEAGNKSRWDAIPRRGENESPSAHSFRYSGRNCWNWNPDNVGAMTENIPCVIRRGECWSYLAQRCRGIISADNYNRWVDWTAGYHTRSNQSAGTPILIANCGPPVRNRHAPLRRHIDTDVIVENDRRDI